MSPERRLADTHYMAFPFRIGEEGAATSRRKEHVREQIEQVLFTDAGERVFRPTFGAGVRRLVFEPNNASLWELVHRRLAASLTEALQGEVDPRTLEVAVKGEEEKLFIEVSYQLATIRQTETHRIPVTSGGSDG